jgi:hypothetical protein
LPVATKSAHWLAEPGFRGAVEDFLRRETAMVEAEAAALAGFSPYRRAGDA